MNTASILTPPAPGAIGVVAIHGPDVITILNSVTSRRCEESEWPVGRPVFCRIKDRDAVLDDAIVCVFHQAGSTFAEIHVHGGVRVVQRVLMVLERAGATAVPAGEFSHVLRSDDAVVRRIDDAIIAAPSRRLLKWLLAQRLILPAYLQRLSTVAPSERAEFRERSKIAVALMRGLRVALIGPPNAGKSTLANCLIGRDRIITSDAPGTTRDWISETALIDGWPVTLTDTAGIRHTECAIESEAIHRSRQQARIADLVVVVMDAATPPSEMDRIGSSLAAMVDATQPVVVVWNKSDLLSSTAASGRGDRFTDEIARRSRTGPFDSAPSCSVSAKFGGGIVELERQLCRMLGLDRLEDRLPTAFFSIEGDERD
ncbi:MAG: 50S ribosome-binding GTPase [Phycisphaerae bacterium]|nr:50S ribosome-binding GTPase [Phycisphaerae bacterium]